ncbi:MAG: hypothetical protein ABSB78_09095 [Bacteroidota bacterium]
MKTKHLVLVALLGLATTGILQAQFFYPVLKNYSAADMKRLDKAYASSLSYPNNNIVEAALALVTMIKLDVPANKFSLIEDKIGDLVIKGETPVIRFKAYLAEMVFTDPDMFREEAVRHYENTDALFSALAERITKTLLSSN